MHDDLRRCLVLTPALVWLLVCNLLDGVLTLVLLESHLVQEVNPILAQAYVVSPVAFMVVKVVSLNCALLLAVLIPNQRTARFFIRLLAVVFAIVVLYECSLVPLLFV